VIAVDTNLLVYAHRADAAFHQVARPVIETLAQGNAQWAIPWPCLHEFIAIVTHPRIFKTPTPLDLALAEMRELAALPNLSLLAEGDGYLERLEAVALNAKIQGGAIHDARIAGICLFHGVAELWSADRDWSRFPALMVRNPLTA
jgi:uncharacterized protein